MRRFLLFSTACAAVLGLFATDAVAKGKAQERVLVMRVEGTELQDKDKSDLFDVIQKKLAKYPSKAIVQPSETAIDELMMEFECFDIDAPCLAKLGKDQKADVIVYVQVDGNPRGYALITRAVRVKNGKVLHDKSEQLRSRSDLPGRLDTVLSRIFGPPPRAKATKGRLVIQSTVPAARIFVNGKYAGSGKIRVKKKEGEYAVRVAKDGYLDKMLTVEVTAGATTKEVVTLDVIPKPVAAVAPVAPPMDPNEVQDDSWYETWWFYTAVSVVTIGATVAIAAAVAEDEVTTEPGRVFVTIEGADAWRDPALLSAGGAP